MIDKKDRKEPRFPADREPQVRAIIKDALLMQKEKSPSLLLGIAGGACGGDILFHEVCEELDIHSEIYLALPPDQFIRQSVAFAGPSWVDRFHHLMAKHPVHILQLENKIKSDTIDDSVWEKANQWMLHVALARGGQAMTLIALWDQKKGDAGGGTEHMVKEAKDQHAETVILDMQKLTHKGE
jgi:hypothetical protein